MKKKMSMIQMNKQLDKNDLKEAFDKNFKIIDMK